MGKKATLADALGARTTEVTLGDKMWTVGQAKIADLARLQSMLDDTRDKPVSSEDIVMEMATPRGSSFLLWCVINKVDKDVTLEDVREMMPLADPTLGGALFKVLGMTDDEVADSENPPTPAGN